MPVDYIKDAIKRGSIICPWKWLVGVFMLVSLIVVVDKQAGWQNVFSSWREIGTKTLIISFFLFVASHFINALRIYELAFSKNGATYSSMVKISSQHQFAINLLPMRLGEIVFPLLVKRHFDTTLKEGLSQLVWLRVMDVCLVVGALLVLLAFKLKVETYLLFVLIFTFVLVFLFIITKFLSRIKFIKTITELLAHTGPNNWVIFLRLVLWTASAWVCKLLGLALLISEFSETPIIHSLFGAMGAEISTLLPMHGVAGAGSFEAAFIGGMSLFEQFDLKMIVVAVNIHIFVILSTTLVMITFLPINISRKQQVNIHGGIKTY